VSKAKGNPPKNVTEIFDMAQAENFDEQDYFD